MCFTTPSLGAKTKKPKKQVKINTTLLADLESESWVNGSRGLKREGRAVSLVCAPFPLYISEQLLSGGVQVSLHAAKKTISLDKFLVDVQIEEPPITSSDADASGPTLSIDDLRRPQDKVIRELSQKIPKRQWPVSTQFNVHELAASHHSEGPSVPADIHAVSEDRSSHGPHHTPDVVLPTHLKHWAEHEDAPKERDWSKLEAQFDFKQNHIDDDEIQLPPRQIDKANSNHVRGEAYAKRSSTAFGKIRAKNQKKVLVFFF